MAGRRKGKEFYLQFIKEQAITFDGVIFWKSFSSIPAAFRIGRFEWGKLFFYVCVPLFFFFFYLLMAV